MPVRYQRANAVQRTRERLDWVEDDDLLLLQDKQPGAAGMLSFFTGGGGQLYVGDYRAGIGLTAAAVSLFAVAVAVVPLAWLPLLALSSASAVNAWRKARAINRHLAAQRAQADHAAPHPPAYRLLAAMSAADPAALREAAAMQGAGLMGAMQPGAPGEAPASPPAQPSAYQETIDRLRKLAALRAGGAMAEHEHRERKVDLLSRACDGLPRDDVDDLLYALLPLLEEGAIEHEDIELVKQLGSA